MLQIHNDRRLIQELRKLVTTIEKKFGSEKNYLKWIAKKPFSNPARIWQRFFSYRY